MRKKERRDGGKNGLRQRLNKNSYKGRCRWTNECEAVKTERSG